MRLFKGCLIALALIAVFWYGVYRIADWMLFEIQKAEVFSLAESFKNGE